MPESNYGHRRQQAMQKIGNAVAVIPTAPRRPRNGDNHYPFRPDSDFYYLTGFAEPEAVAVLLPEEPGGEFILFCRESDAEKEIWDGRRAGLQGAVERYGADLAYPIEALPQMLPKMLEGREQVFSSLGSHPEIDTLLLNNIALVKQKNRSGAQAPGALADLDPILHAMRLCKDEAELDRMRRAAKLSAEAHCQAMRRTRPGCYEYEVQAELERHFMLGGSHAPAYPSIVAGGENACILHYVENNCRLRDGDLLLIDAGAELDCYASDITRTFPVNGRFSDAQRELYEVVLMAQKAAIETVQPDNSWNLYHEVTIEKLTEGLMVLGILNGERDELIAEGRYKRFYMHRAGHWLGMDVHDVGDYKIDDNWRPLEPGMVLTVEPGLYIQAAEDINPRWHNLGIRIEDDVVVTPQGHEILTGDVPKEIDDIERLMTESS